MRSTAALALLLFASPAQAVIDTDEELVISAGETYQLWGDHTYSDRVIVEIGGTLTVTPFDGVENGGWLTLRAPQISINGEVVGQGSGAGGGGGGMNNMDNVPASYAQGGSEGAGGVGGSGFWGATLQRGGGGGGGGAGGAAVALYAGQFLLVSGTINMTGAGGGQSGSPNHGSIWGGGGGGGGVLLHSPDLQVSGTVDVRGRRANAPSRINGGTIKVFHGALSENGVRYREGRLYRFQINSPPEITSVQGNSLQALEGLEIQVALSATDDDGDAIVGWGLSDDAPPEARVEGDGAQATLIWTPSHFSERQMSFGVTATDAENSTGEFRLSIEVVDTNGPPGIFGIGRVVTAEDETFTHSIWTEDPDGDGAVLELTDLPDGAAFDPESGILTWLPTNDDIGEHVVNCTATEDSEAARQATGVLTIVVTDTNDPPVITSDPLVAAVAGSEFSVTLTAVDPDPGEDQLVWALVTAPFGMAMNPGTGEVTWSVPGDQIGATMAIEVTVTDENSASATQRSQLEITAGADAPTAAAGDDLESGPATITFDGSGSTDPNGAALTYQWRQVATEFAPLVVIEARDSATPTVSLSRRGTYRFELRVHNGTFRSTPAYLTVTVIDVPPIADAGEDRKIGVPEGTHWLVYLDGSASGDPNPEDSVTFAWALAGEADSIAPILAHADRASTSVDLPGRGTYEFELTVTSGENEVTDTVTIGLVDPDDLIIVPPTDPEPAGCGCASAPLGMLWLLPLVGLRRRRRGRGRS